MRRRRADAADLDLWRRAMQGVVPLPGRPTFPERGHPARQPARENAGETPALRKPSPSATHSRPSEPPLDRLAGVDRASAERLKRGKRPVEARLDLHGMTQSRAHQALHHFLHRAQRDGLTFVLVITGKGTIGADPERGVLRRQVPLWLALPEFRSLVVGFEDAHVGHGGQGALYVRLRRGAREP